MCADRRRAEEAAPIWRPYGNWNICEVDYYPAEGLQEALKAAKISGGWPEIRGIAWKKGRRW